MQVRFGEAVPSGWLPVFSVSDEAEAQALIVLACNMNNDGTYFARELAVEQTLENLEAFSDKLDRAHDFMIEKGTCRCTKDPIHPVGKQKGHSPRKER